MQQSLTLNNSIIIPQLGFGTWKITGDDGQHSIETALELGYRHIDTAEMYGNHNIVKQAITKSGIARSDLFLTSKLGLKHRSYTEVIEAGKQYLQELNTAYLDMLLIHWPNHASNLEDTLHGMLELQQMELVRAIGVCNFTQHHLQDILDLGIQIQMNQVELHPSLPQNTLVDFCKKHSIAVTAYSPLGRGEDLELDVLQTIASAHDCTTAQVALAWLLERELIVIPKASSKEHAQSNFAAQAIGLNAEEITAINDIQKQDNRLVNPDFAEFEY